MALSIGELVGFVDLDTGPAKKGIGFLDKLFGKSGSRWGKMLGGAGIAAGGAFAMSLAGAINLEPSRDRVAAALGLTEKQAARAGAVSGQLYADGWGESGAAVDAAIEAVMSSIDGARDATESDLQAMTRQALTFAETMGVDVGRAAQVAGNMIANGLAKNATEAFDLLTSASSKVPKELREDVLDAADEYGQFFTQLGIDGPQAMAMLAAGAKKGMYGIDKAGDAVKEFTIRATDMSAQTKDAYAAIGLDAHKMAADILAGGNRAKKATDRIVSGLLSIKDPAKRAQASVALFGTPLEDLSTKDIPTFLRSLQSGAKGLGKWRGATKKAGQTLTDNASRNITKFKRTLKVAFIDMLGGKVLPVVTDWSGIIAQKVGPALGTLAGILSGIAGVMGDHEKAVLGIASAIALFLLPNLILQGATALKSAAMSVRAWVMQQTAAAKTVAKHVATAAIMVAKWVFMGAQSLIQAARMAAAWVIAMGPVAWVIAAIVGLVAIVIANWDKIVKWTKKAWRWIVDVVKKAWQWIKDAVKAGVTFVKKIITAYVKLWKKIITKAWDAIVAVVRKVWDIIVGLIKAKIRMVLDVIGWFKRLPGKLRDWFGRAKDAAARALGRLVDVAKKIPGKVVSALSSIGSKMLGIGKDVVSGIWSGITSMGGWLKDKLVGWAKSVIPGPIAKAMGIASPSKLMAREIGRWLPAGVVEGAMANSGVLDRAGDSMAARLVGSTSRALSSRMPQLGRRQDTPREVYRERTVVERNAPLIGTVEQRDDEDAQSLAERLWFINRKRG